MSGAQLALMPDMPDARTNHTYQHIQHEFEAQAALPE